MQFFSSRVRTPFRQAASFLVLVILAAPLTSHAQSVRRIGGANPAIVPARVEQSRTDQEKIVSLRMTAKPLKQVVAEIAQQTRSTITVDQEIAERKLVCLVNGVKENELLARIAMTLGADCMRHTDTDGVRFHLAIKPMTRFWLRSYDSSRTAARKAAADRLANQIHAQFTKSLREMLNRSDPNREPVALKIARMMPEGAWRTMAQAKAEGLEGQPGGELITLSSKPVYTLPLSSLSLEGQETVRKAIRPLPEQVQQRYSPESSLLVTISIDSLSSNQPFISIGKPDKKGIVSGGYSEGLAASLPMLFASQPQRAAFQGEELLRNLKAAPVPKDAVLGFTVTGDGTCAKPARLGVDSPKVMPKMDTPSRVELLTRIHESLRLNVVSDYYTDDERLERVGATWESTLQGAAQAFRCVFREEGRYLLSRTTDFAERNYTEAPYPLFEEAIAIRTQQAEKLGDTTPQVTGFDFSSHPERDRPLPLRLLLDLYGLPHEQFAYLAHYDDKRRSVRFRDLHQLLFRYNARVPEYMLLGLVGHVDPSPVSGGVPFGSIPLALREIISTDTAIKDQLERAPSTSDGMLHLRWLPHSYFVNRYGANARKELVGWYLQIVWPGRADRTEQVVFVRDNILAQPPDPKDSPRRIKR